MIIIKHRVNSINGIKKTPTKYGVEIDLRSNKNSKGFRQHCIF